MALYIGNQRVAPTMLPSGGVSIPLEVSANGSLSKPQTSFIWSLPSVKTIIYPQVLAYAFYQTLGLTSVDLSSLTTVSGQYVMQWAFYQCINLTNVDLSSLTTVSGDYMMYHTFQECRNLTNVDLSSLTTISSNNYAMSSAFSGCTSLTTVSFPSLTTIKSNSAMSSAFSGCTSLTTLSFSSLNSNSFGSNTNQFSNMLQGVTGCTVHFPSNLQSVIGGWSSVISGFGGTNTTVLFDLPATT